MEDKTYRTEVRTDSDFDDIPEVAVFSIGEDTAKEIANLAALVKEHGLHKVEKFDYRANFYRYDPEENAEDAEEAGEENDQRTECDCLNVSETEFWFSAYLKHTDVEVHTEWLPIADLLAHFGIGVAEQANLPLRYWAVTGRIPGADEDSLYVFHVATRKEALDAFAEAIWEDEPDAEAVRDAVMREHGQPVFWNSVAVSDSPILEA